MATRIDIANLALIRASVQRIGDFAEESEPARHVRALWDSSRDAVLRSHPWGFARKRVYPALLDETPSGWEYAYARPADCLLIRMVVNPSSDAPDQAVKWEEGLSEDGSRIAILTDEEDAEIEYTARVENVALWDSVFVEAFTWRLAADLVATLKGDAGIARGLQQQAMMAVAEAQRLDANEGNRRPEAPNPYIAARR